MPARRGSLPCAKTVQLTAHDADRVHILGTQALSLLNTYSFKKDMTACGGTRLDMSVKPGDQGRGKGSV